MIEAPSDSPERFGFGANWRRFLESVDEDRILVAQESIQETLGLERLDGRLFLDVGSGSGLFSLAAHRMGASVVSFDFDPMSVVTTREIQRRFAAPDAWPVYEGSVLDEHFMAALGTFDVVYSFGVLHHTGQMWRAIDQTAARVASGGILYIALYNDQGRVSKVWYLVKALYNRMPRPVRPAYVVIMAAPREFASLTLAILAGDPSRYVHGWTRYKSARGMSRWHDLVDWIGGLPFEVADPGVVVNRLIDQGFSVTRLVTRGRRLGCNDFVFTRTTDSE